MARETEETLFVGIPSGYPKRYCLLLMGHALQNLDAENIEVHWALTDRGTEPNKQYHDEVEQVMDITGLPYKIHNVPVTQTEANTAYVPILKNRKTLREAFLDTDAEEFLLIGGDNPPWRNAVQLLRECEADIAFGLSYQRPDVDILNRGVYPLLWRPIWTMKDVNKHTLSRKERQAFRSAFIKDAVQLPIYLEENWEKQSIADDVVGGDGNCLIKREVLERFGWIMPTHSKVSEDMLFMRTAMAYDYKVKCRVDYKVPHIHLSDEGMKSY